MTKGSDRRRLLEILSVVRRLRILKSPTPKKVRQAFEELGPTFVKLGQILSMRPDIIPTEYCDEFMKLRTDVAPMPYKTVIGVVEKEYGKAFGEIFSAMDETCSGSASIAQVHRARLKNGDRVVVKVQRPGIYELMERDVVLLRRLGRLVKLTPFGDVVDINIVIDEMWSTAQEEMNFLTEAEHIEEFRRLNEGLKYIYCPRVYSDLSTERVLVMECIDGVRIDDVRILNEQGYDLDEIGRKLAMNYIKQIIDDRYFHADPHPGNIFIKDGRIVWLDMGMMGRMTEFDAKCYRDGIQAVIDHDCEKIKDIVLAMGFCRGRVDEVHMVEDFNRFLDRYGSMPIEDMNLGIILTEAIDLAKSYRITMPAGMTMIARGITTLEGLLEVISPGINVIGMLAAMKKGTLLDEIDFGQEGLNLLKSLLSSGTGLTKIPGQYSSFLSRLENGKLKTNIELVGADALMDRIDESTGRLAAALLGGLLVSGGCTLRTKNRSDPLGSAAIAAGFGMSVMGLAKRKKQ